MLLDTHVWIWSAADEPGRLGRRTRQQVARASERGELLVSPVSVYELSALCTMGRVQLAHSIDQWVRDSVEIGDLRIVELTVGMALDAGAIPSPALPDPIDRLLVATARALGVPLVTRDRRILDYAAHTRDVRVIDAAA